MACLIPENWPVQYNDEDPENGNEAEYKADGLKDLIVKESKSAKLNVIVCFVINLIVQMHLSIVDISITDTDLLETLDVDTTEANSANNIYKSLTNLYAPLALYLMSKSSYRTTVAVGSLIVCVAFANISFLNNGPEGTINWYWQVWLCGPVALGVSCLKLGAIIPVLEYFKRDRMKALVITRIGTVLGASASIGVMFAESLSWRTLLRINAGLCLPCLAIAFILKDIVITDKLKKENDGNETTDENKKENKDKKGCSGIIKEFLKHTFRIPVLKDKTFWITIVVFFFFSFGTSLPTFSLPEISSQMQEQLAPPVDSFYEVLSANVGTLLGLILTYLLKSLPCVESYRNRKRNMGFVFCIITLSGYIMAILSIVTQENFVYYIVYILVLTIFEVLTENFRDESMPTAFGRFNIRLTQGFLQMSVGLGGLTAATFQNGVNKADNGGGWKLNFRLGGGFLLISGSITGVVLAFDFISKRTFLRHSCFVNILTDGTITKQKPSPTKSKTCCNYLCCINYWTKTENEGEKTSKCTDCCDGCTAFNFPQCLTLSYCSRKRPNEPKEPQSCELPCACCKGFSLSCFSSCLRKKQNKQNDPKQRKCCQNCSPLCIPKCLSMSCFSKSRPKSESDESEQKPCFSMPCLARKGSISENDIEVDNPTENKGCTRGLSKCFKFSKANSQDTNIESDPKKPFSFNCFHGIVCKSMANKVTPTEKRPRKESTPKLKSGSEQDNKNEPEKKKDNDNKSFDRDNKNKSEDKENKNHSVDGDNKSEPEKKDNDDKSVDGDNKITSVNGSRYKDILFNCCPQFQKKRVHLGLSVRSSLSIQKFDQVDTETDAETLTSSNDVSEILTRKESTPKLKSESEQDYKFEPEKKDHDNNSVDGDNKNKSEDKENKNKSKSVDRDSTNDPEKKDNDNESVDGDNGNEFEDKDNKNIAEIEDSDNDNKNVCGDNKNEHEKKDNDNESVDGDNGNEFEDKDNKNIAEVEDSDNDNKSVCEDNKNEPEKEDNDNESVDGDNRNEFEDKDNKNIAEVEDSVLSNDTEQKTLATDAYIFEKEFLDKENETSTKNPNEENDRNNDNSQIRNGKPTSPNEKPKTKAFRIKKMSKKTRKKIKSPVVSQSADKKPDQHVDFEDELMADCPRFERALSPPYKHITLNRRLQYEAYRAKANNEC